MILHVFDGDYKALGVIQRFDKMQWLRCWTECPEFLVQLSGTHELLQRGNVIKAGGNIGIIEQVTIDASGEGEVTTARGRGLLSLLGRRIVASAFTYVGDVADVIMQLITSNLRGLEFAVNVESGTMGAQLEYCAEVGDNLLDCVTAIADAVGIGLKVDLVDGVPTLRIARGQMRSGYFALENGTLLTREYDDADTDYRNVCYVECEGRLIIVGDASGDDRREHFISMAAARDEEGNELSATDQEALMREKALETLAGLQQVKSLTCTLNPYGQLTYELDYDLGDQVMVRADAWGIRMIAQILKVKEIYEESGESLELTFGNEYLTQNQRIKRGVI